MGRLIAWSVAVGSLSILGAVAADAQEMRTLVRPRATRVVQEAVLKKLETENMIPVWVYFTDKGVHDDTGLARALDRPEQFMSARALERQRKRNKPLGIRDLPVVETYVDGVAATGAEIRHRLRWFNAVTVNATPGQIIRLSNLSFVSAIDVIRGYPTHPPTPEELGLQGHVPPPPLPESERRQGEAAFYGFTPTQYTRTQVVLAHEAGYTGAGVRIVMFDTGFDADHPALRELPLIAEWDFVQGDANTAEEPGNSPPDEEDFGRNGNWCHGTSTWSVAGGYLPGYHVGVAFGAEFAIAKTEYPGYERHVEEDNWAAAAEWVHNEVGGDIISSSLGYRYDFDDTPGEYGWEQLDGKTTIVAQAANIAGENGILVINSAGNDARRSADSFRTINSPSDSDSVLAVGAVYPENERVTDFSSRGPAAPACPGCDQRIKPDVLAQGTLVHAATASAEFGCYDYENPNFPAGPHHNDGDPDYDQIDVSGTSFSCPLVAGMAALLLEAHNWEPHEARLALKETASDRAQGINPSSERGYGVVRILNAINYTGMGIALPPLRPGPFALVSPERFIGTNALTDPLPTYTWEESGPSRFQQPRTYTLEIATDIHFENMIHTETTDALTLTPSSGFPSEGYYYWRVVSSDGSQFTRQSSQRNRILHDNPPQPFALLSPPNAGNPPEQFPTLRWQESIDLSPDDTVEYTLYISRNPGAEGGRVFTGIPDTTFTLPPDAPVSESVVHYWRVEATDRFGAVARSATFGFLAAAFPPAAFTLLGPSAGDSVATLRPTLTWQAAVDPNPDDQVRYEVYWGLDPDDLDGPFTASQDTSLRVGFGELEDDRTYYWMVEAIDNFTNTTRSSADSFHVWLAPQPFALTAPPHGGTVHGTPTFRWAVPVDESPDDSHRYTLTVYADSTLTTTLRSETDITATSHTLDLGLTEDTTVWWRVMATDEQGRSVWSSDAYRMAWSSAPPAFAVRSFPNPLNPALQPLTIQYDVPADMGGRPLAISIFDGQGRRVRNLASGAAEIGGGQMVTWDARSDSGSPVAAGIYFARVDVGGAQDITKVIVLGP